MITFPPINDMTLLKTGRFTFSWVKWFQSVYKALSGPLPLVSYTVSSLPSAVGEPSLIYVSDEAGGAVPAFNDGTNWRRVTDRAIVS